MGDILPVHGEAGGGGGGGEAEGCGVMRKPVKNSRKKKLNTNDIRFYNDEE